jgi:hypothetical protein
LSAQHLGFGPAVPQNVTNLSELPLRPDAAGRVDSPVSPSKDTGPVIHAEAAPAPPAFERPAGLPVFLARLQRMLLPEAVGATTSDTVSR